MARRPLGCNSFRRVLFCGDAGCDRRVLAQYARQVSGNRVFCAVGTLTGILADRERRQKTALQQKTEQLKKLYSELHDNFEHLKRTERLHALGQLSAGLAHEIRNPLASIEGAARVIQREQYSSERHSEFLDIIQKECRRLSGLLANFLDFAKPRFPDLTKVEANALLESVIALAQHAAAQNRFVFRKEISNGFSTIHCDAEQLKQVLLNLTINAMQAMPMGGAITFAARRTDSQVLLEVHDEGSGIDLDNAEKIFDPFFTTKHTGSGLGLSVAHQIVLQHGGSLTISRNTQQGATFRIALPLPPDEHEQTSDSRSR